MDRSAENWFVDLFVGLMVDDKSGAGRSCQADRGQEPLQGDPGPGTPGETRVMPHPLTPHLGTEGPSKSHGKVQNFSEKLIIPSEPELL